MTDINWYTNLTADDILKELSRIAHNACANVIQGNLHEGRLLEKEFDQKFNEVIPAIVDVKSEYYVHRSVNDVYDTWDKLQKDLWTVKKGMEDTIYLAYKEKGGM